MASIEPNINYLTSLDLEGMQRLISDLPPLVRIRFAAMLADGKTRGWMVESADAAAWELTRSMTHQKLADLLGVGVTMVNRRVCRHKRRTHGVDPDDL